MKRQINYSEEPMGEFEVVKDFLPPPEELAFRDDGVKVTLSLSPKSVAFFKSQAKALKSPYQRMIRRLIDLYVEQHSQ